VPKIVEGRLNAWYKDRVLLEQPFVRDEKQTIEQLLGDAKIARFAQVTIGA
jgi:elongation factor Ts